MTSCYYYCDESKLPRNTYLLPNDAKAAFAYKGKDNLRFLRNNKDTILFTSESVDTFYRESTRILECDGEVAFFEGYKLSLQSTLSNSIQIELSYPEFNPTITGVSIVYGQLQSGIYFISSKKFNDNADLDSLIINQKKYYNVFKLNNIEEDTIFYNQQYGILKIVNKLEKLELL